MDYHSLKRRELQALCKKHNIPANSASSVLADKLSALLNEKPKQKTRQRTCMKSSVETTDEGEPAELKRQSKKVRFSPNNDLVEYELRSGEKKKEVVTQTRARRKSVAKKVDKPVDDNTTVELIDDSTQIPVKVTRSRAQSSGKDVVIPNNEKKKGRREAKDVEKETDVNVGKVTRSKAHTLQKGGDVQHEENKQSKRTVKEVKEESETVKETVVARVRVTRSKAQTLTEGGTSSDANPQLKKKSGKQVKLEGQTVEPKEVMDLPVRATRSRGQTTKEDIGNTVTNTQADKKRTRREMKATDLSSNSSHVAPVDKQEPPKRKSLRTRGVETVDEDDGDKMEVVNGSRVTRSKAPLATEGSGRNNKNKASKVEIQQPEEPVKHAVKKNVNRKKSVLETEKTEVDPLLEEPVNYPARKNTRRNSMLPKATTTVESPVGKKQSKGLEDKENVTRSGKDASEIEIEEVTAGTPKSRKRRGTPIIEDQIISPKSSTRSASRSEGKSVVKKQVESSLKKPMSRVNSPSSVENASLEGKNSALRSGSIIRDSVSKKRAKLSGTKHSDSEDHAVNSSKEWTPVAKMKNLKLDEEVTEPEVTPAIDKSGRRFTRSAIKSERKQPSQSAIKKQSIAEAQVFSPKVAKMKNLKHDEEVTEPEVTPAIDKSGRRSTRSAIKSERKEPRQPAIKEQPIAEAQLFSPKVAKFRSDPAANTAPGRITRTGIKRGGNAAGSFSEKVGKNKQTRQSTHKKTIDEAQMASPEVAEVGPNLDVGTIGVQSKIKQLLDEVHMSSPEVAKVGPNPDAGTIGVQSEIKQPLDEVQMSSPEVAEFGSTPDVGTLGVRSQIKQPLDELQMSSPQDAEVKPNQGVDTIGVQSETEKPYDDGQMCSPEVAEVQPNPDSDAVEVGSAISKEVAGQTLGDISASVSARLPTKVVDENIVSASGTVIDMESASPVTGENASDVGTPLGKNLSHIKKTPVSMSDVAETVPDAISDVSHVQNQNEKVYVESRIISEDLNLETSVLKPGRPDAREKMESTESGSTLKGMQTDVMIEEQLVSVGNSVVVEDVDISSLGVATKGTIGDADNNRDPVSYDVVSSVDKHDVDDGEQYDEDESTSAQKPLSPEPDSEDRGVVDGVDVQDNPFSSLDMFGTPLIAKGDVQDDGMNAPKEFETGSELSNANKTLDVPISGIDIDIERVVEDDSVVRDGEAEHDQLASNDNHATDEEDVGCDDSEPAQKEIMRIERVVEDDSVVRDGEAKHDQLASNDNHVTDEDVGCDDSEPAQNEIMPVATEVLVKSCDQEPEQSLTVAFEDVPSDTIGQSDSEMSKDVPKDDMVVRVDALEESAGDINKDVVSSILGDIYDMDAEGDSGKEQKLTEFDEGFLSNESRGISSDMINEQTKEEAETSRGNNHTLDDQERAAATDVDSDSGKYMEYDSHVDVNEVNSEVGIIKAHEDPTREEALPVLYTEGETTVDGLDSSQLMGDIGAHESPITKESSPITYKKEESPVDDMDTDLLTFKEDDGNKQEETQNAGTSVDWGDYDLGLDEFEKPVSANKSAGVEGEGKKDDQDSDLQTSARTSSSIEESSGLASGMANSVRKLEKDSRNAADGKSNLEVDMLKESANAADMTEDGFNWSDSSIKSIFALPSATRISNARDSQEDAVKLVNEDTYSSLKPLFTTPATSQVSHVKDTLVEATGFADRDHYSSLKSLFATPATSRKSHVNDGKADAVNFTFPDGRCNEDIGSSRTSAHEFNHQWDHDQSKDFDGNTQGNTGPENEIHGVPSFEDYSLKLFEDEEVGGEIDRSRSNTHFEFKQFEFLNEAAGTSHHDHSSLKDDSNRSREFEKKEDSTQMKGSETDNDLSFHKGHE